MLKLQNLTKRFGEKTVIENLTHAFPDAGAVALMGPSGCGKTTLLRLIAGLEKPDDGTVEKEGLRISYAFQEPRLAPTLTCRENVALVLEKGKDAAVDELLSAFELQEAAAQYPAALSGGMRQRVSLARALAYGGDVLLVTHDRGEAYRLCETVCVLDGGKSTERTTVRELMAEPRTVGAALISGCKTI